MNQNNGEIILYQPDNNIRLEVRIQEETVWLTQQQMAFLYGVDRTVIVKHIGNIYKTKELQESTTCAKIAQVQSEGGRNVLRKVNLYSLDMIISVGYRVNSVNATRFRQWANSVLKDYLLRGYAINKRFERLEQRVAKTEEQIGFFVRTALPPTEGIFYDGQIFDAYTFVADLIRSAHERVILIDNYVDDSVLKTLTKRGEGVNATIITRKVSEAFFQTIVTAARPWFHSPSRNRSPESINLVPFIVPHRRSHARVCVATLAQVRTGVILADVFAHDAAAESVLTLVAVVLRLDGVLLKVNHFSPRG